MCKIEFVESIGSKSNPFIFVEKKLGTLGMKEKVYKDVAGLFIFLSA